VEGLHTHCPHWTLSWSSSTHYSTSVHLNRWSNNLIVVVVSIIITTTQTKTSSNDSNSNTNEDNNNDNGTFYIFLLIKWRVQLFMAWTYSSTLFCGVLFCLLNFRLGPVTEWLIVKDVIYQIHTVVQYIEFDGASWLKW
jgi:1,4-dihydroxy-2-naphthoate octaprenyltransferase